MHSNEHAAVSRTPAPTHRALRFMTSARVARYLAWLAGTLALSAAVLLGNAYAAEKPILIGQSVPMGMANFKIASAISDATRALVDAVNDGGGIGGRPVELITLQDDGTPEGYADNVAQLLEEDGVLAVINCVGDRVCDAAVPIIGKADGVLVGTISGATALRGAGGGRVFPVRGDYAAEAEKLARQMATIGILRAVIMSDATSLPEKNDALTRALEANHIKVSRITADERALDTLKGIKPDALVLDLSASTAMTTPLLQPDNQSQLPPIVVSMADPSLVMTVPSIRGRMLGFTTVVPNPEASPAPLANEFRRVTAELPLSTNYLGFEAYLNLRVVLDAIGGISGVVDRASLRTQLQGMSDRDIGGLRITPTGASDKTVARIGLGVLSSAGYLIE
ncbi:ABC transporter substrate-binding protein [Nitrogeniibacter aestuarii]|uniref:ABC transporter substrate-binding protein n=1 Tax=Nitrogeniibacter aestuarii TaxID=2815343 RepID=UPI001E2A9C06|nr:ABC transporter substrate-binding protein [Nitrogeniibacter aestuarii]